MSPFESLVEESARLTERVEGGEPLRDLAEEAKSLETRWREARACGGFGPKNLHKKFEENIRQVFAARNAAWADAAGIAQAVIAEAADLANWAGWIYTHYAADLRDRFFAVGDLGPTRKQLRSDLEAAIAAAFATLPRRGERRDDTVEDDGGVDGEMLQAAEMWAALENAGGGRGRRNGRR
jgi:hypothetical protein